MKRGANAFIQRRSVGRYLGSQAAYGCQDGQHSLKLPKFEYEMRGHGLTKAQGSTQRNPSSPFSPLRWNVTELGERVWIKKTPLQLPLGFEAEIRFRELSPAHDPKSFFQNQAAHFSDCLASLAVGDLFIRISKQNGKKREGNYSWCWSYNWVCSQRIYTHELCIAGVAVYLGTEQGSNEGEKYR